MCFQGSIVGAVSLGAYFRTYSGYFSPFENKVSTTCDDFNLSRLSVFNHRYPVPRDLKSFSALGPESKVISKFSFRLSGCLIMVFQVSCPGYVKTYRDSSTHKMQDSVSVHTSYWAIWFWLAYSSRLSFFPFGIKVDLLFLLYGSGQETSWYSQWEYQYAWKWKSQILPMRSDELSGSRRRIRSLSSFRIIGSFVARGGPTRLRNLN